MSMKSHHYSAPPKGGHKQHHKGHKGGHPTELGHSGGVESGSEGSRMSEWGLSEGNAKGMKHNNKLDVTQQPETHELQHVDYEEITGM